MDRDDLHDLWQADAGRGLQNKDRPAFVREHREAIMEHTNTDDPVPDADSLAAIRDWLERYKSTVTRQLGENTNGDGEETGE